MSGISATMAGYLHTYEAYRVPKGTKVKDSLGEEVVLSDEEDVLVLTEKAGKQLIKDRQDHLQMLMMNADMASIRSQNASAEKSAKDLAKIMAVYRSMAKGDIVPAGDEMKLQEYNSDLYQSAKIAQSLARIEERKKKDSEWDDAEEEAYARKKSALNEEADAALNAVGNGAQEFSDIQKDCIVEVDSSGVDFSSMQVTNLGMGVSGANFDLSV